MLISKEKLEDLIKGLPQDIDIEDLMQRLYLLEKIEAGEKDIKEGNTLSHEDAAEKISKRWQQ